MQTMKCCDSSLLWSELAVHAAPGRNVYILTKQEFPLGSEGIAKVSVQPDMMFVSIETLLL